MKPASPAAIRLQVLRLDPHQDLFFFYGLRGIRLYRTDHRGCPVNVVDRKLPFHAVFQPIPDPKGIGSVFSDPKTGLLLPDFPIQGISLFVKATARASIRLQILCFKLYRNCFPLPLLFLYLKALDFRRCPVNIGNGNPVHCLISQKILQKQLYGSVLRYRQGVLICKALSSVHAAGRSCHATARTFVRLQILCFPGNNYRLSGPVCGSLYRFRQGRACPVYIPDVYGFLYGPSFFISAVYCIGSIFLCRIFCFRGPTGLLIPAVGFPRQSQIT